MTIRAGVQDIGGGQASSLCQIAAEVLGVHPEDVKIYIADTALTPLSGTTTATRQLYMSGNATLQAAREVRKTLLKKAGEILETDPDLLDLADRKVIRKGDSKETGLNLPDVVKACASDGLPLYNVGLFKAPFRNLTQFVRIEGQVFPDFTFGSHAVEVAVDQDTGALTVKKLVACYDVGRAINPLSAEGQIEGGAVYALGYGISEEVVIREGKIQTPFFFRVSYSHLPGCAGSAHHRPRIGRRRGSFRGQRGGGAVGQLRGPSHRQRGVRCRRGAHPRPAHHSGKGVQGS